MRFASHHGTAAADKEVEIRTSVIRLQYVFDIKLLIAALHRAVQGFTH